jgi:hypothetical protein
MLPNPQTQPCAVIQNEGNDRIVYRIEKSVIHKFMVVGFVQAVAVLTPRANRQAQGRANLQLLQSSS